MPDPTHASRRRSSPAILARLALLAMAGTLLAGCVLLDPSPSPTAVPETATPSATEAPTDAPTETPESTSPATETASPSPSPEPPLSLPLPEERDVREVEFAVVPQVSGASGQVLVTVTNLSDTRIAEILLRWPSELDAWVRLAPFVATFDRIRDGGPPLRQDWSRWVLGPGESGEPEGTITLGYGPLDPGATLEIPLLVIGRDQPGPVGFDLQFLSGEWGAPGTLLAIAGGEPAEIRVEIP